MRYAIMLMMALALAACASDGNGPEGVRAIEPPGALPRPPSGDRVPDALRPPR